MLDEVVQEMDLLIESDMTVVDCCFTRQGILQKRSLEEVQEMLSSVLAETNVTAYRGMKEWRCRQSRHHAIANTGIYMIPKREHLS